MSLDERVGRRCNVYSLLQNGARQVNPLRGSRPKDVDKDGQLQQRRGDDDDVARGLGEHELDAVEVEEVPVLEEGAEARRSEDQAQRHGLRESRCAAPLARNALNTLPSLFNSVSLLY